MQHINCYTCVIIMKLDLLITYELDNVPNPYGVINQACCIHNDAIDMADYLVHCVLCLKLYPDFHLLE